MPTTKNGHRSPVRLVFGTRGSLLATTQTQQIMDLLGQTHPELELSVEIIRTEGDDLQQEARPEAVWPHLGVGVFTRQLESALLNGSIDIAVHSLKDLPTRCPDGLVLAAVPERASSWDLLVFPSDPGPTTSWPQESWAIGTSSIRRIAFLSRKYPNWRHVPIRGNVDTRLKKMHDGACSALVLAAAGLQRLEWWNPSAPHLLQAPCGTFFAVPLHLDCGILPAPGQGALAVEMRADDPRIPLVAAALDHSPTAAAVSAERAFLEHLGGGCRVPIGALAQASGRHTLLMHGMVTSPDGGRMCDGTISGPLQDAVLLGRQLATRLTARGAKALLEEAE